MEKWATFDFDPEVTLANMKTEVFLDDDKSDVNITQLYEEVYIKSENDESVKFTHDVVVNSVPQGRILGPEDQVLHNNEEKGLLICYHCNYSADHKTLLIDHMKAHTNGKHAHMDSTNENIINQPNFVTSKSSRQLRCEGCDATFNRKIYLDKHMLKKHPQFISSVTSKVHGCKICTFKTTVKSDFDTHMRKHCGERPRPKFRSCIHCNARFSSKASVDDHILRKHPKFSETVTSKIHECKFCIYKTTIITDFKSHMLQHAETKSSYIFSNCNFCEAKFIKKRSLDNHILRNHPNFIELVTSKIYECKICMFKTTIKNGFYAHMKKHPGEKPSDTFRSCIHCNARFSSKALMDDHVLRRHPKSVETVTSKTHECKFCVYKTTIMTEFKRHMLQHAETKSSKFNNCNFCEAKFPKRRSLDNHILRKHPNFIESVTSKIHECKMCNFKTTLKGGFYAHMRKHTGEGYPCMHCNALFKSKRYIDDHILKKHPEFSKLITTKVLECEVCMFKTIQKSSFDRHVKTHSKGAKHICKHCNETFKSKKAVDDHLLRKHPKFIV